MEIDVKRLVKEGRVKVVVLSIDPRRAPTTNNAAHAEYFFSSFNAQEAGCFFASDMAEEFIDSSRVGISGAFAW